MYGCLTDLARSYLHPSNKLSEAKLIPLIQELYDKHVKDNLDHPSYKYYDPYIECSEYAESGVKQGLDSKENSDVTKEAKDKADKMHALIQLCKQDYLTDSAYLASLLINLAHLGIPMPPYCDRFKSKPKNDPLIVLFVKTYSPLPFHIEIHLLYLHLYAHKILNLENFVFVAPHIFVMLGRRLLNLYQMLDDFNKYALDSDLKNLPIKAQLEREINYYQKLFSECNEIYNSKMANPRMFSGEAQIMIDELLKRSFHPALHSAVYSDRAIIDLIQKAKPAKVKNPNNSQKTQVPHEAKRLNPVKKLTLVKDEKKGPIPIIPPPRRAGGNFLSFTRTCYQPIVGFGYIRGRDVTS